MAEPYPLTQSHPTCPEHGEWCSEACSIEPVYFAADGRRLPITNVTADAALVEQATPLSQMVAAYRKATADTSEKGRS